MLKVAYINTEKIAQEERANALWNEVLKPKHEARERKKTRKLFLKYGIPLPDEWRNEML